MIPKEKPLKNKLLLDGISTLRFQNGVDNTKQQKDHTITIYQWNIQDSGGNNKQLGRFPIVQAIHDLIICKYIPDYIVLNEAKTCPKPGEEISLPSTPSWINGKNQNYDGRTLFLSPCEYNSNQDYPPFPIKLSDKKDALFHPVHIYHENKNKQNIIDGLFGDKQNVIAVGDFNFDYWDFLCKENKPYTSNLIRTTFSHKTIKCKNREIPEPIHQRQGQDYVEICDGSEPESIITCKGYGHYDYMLTNISSPEIQWETIIHTFDDSCKVYTKDQKANGDPQTPPSNHFPIIIKGTWTS